MRIPALWTLACTLLTPLSAQVAEIVPLSGAPYSASATVAPEAVKIFTGTYTASGRTLEAQADAAFAALAADLKKAGGSLADVVNIRGYLLVDPADSQMEGAMNAWNGAFNQHFGQGDRLPPTRTTIGVTKLPEAQAKVAFDAVVALPTDKWPQQSPRLSNGRVVDLSPRLTAVQPFSALVLTSGMLASPGKDGQLGDMQAQSLSTMDKLAEALAHWGASPRDVVFARAMLSPPLPAEGAPAQPVDFEGFAAAWKEYWAARRMPAPALSEFAAPGFNANGMLVEIEFYAALPTAAGPGATAQREGDEASFLSRSTLVGREAALTWFSGVVDTSRQGHHGQGAGALLTLTDRMTVAGVTTSDIVQLRAYLDIEEDFGSEFGAWNQAYGRFFNHPKLNPTKPIRTAFPVEATPGASVIEIELIGISSKWK